MIYPNWNDFDAMVSRMTDAQKKQLIDRILRSMGDSSRDAPGPMGRAAEAFAGGWTEEEASAIERAISDGRTIDPELWR